MTLHAGLVDFRPFEVSTAECGTRREAHVKAQRRHRELQEEEAALEGTAGGKSTLGAASSKGQGRARIGAGTSRERNQGGRGSRSRRLGLRCQRAPCSQGAAGGSACSSRKHEATPAANHAAGSGSGSAAEQIIVDSGVDGAGFRDQSGSKTPKRFARSRTRSPSGGELARVSAGCLRPNGGCIFGCSTQKNKRHPKRPVGQKMVRWS